jgi:hypothetical protein
MFKKAFKRHRIFSGRSSSPHPLDRDDAESKPTQVQENQSAQSTASSTPTSHLDTASAASKSASNTGGADTDSESTGVDSIDENDSYGIKILYYPSPAAIDIVFIHGLTGNAYSTWLHKSTNIHWPRDLIKDDITDARVMTFGYDVDVAHFWGQVAQDGISGYARDLLGKLARKRQSVVCC